MAMAGGANASSNYWSTRSFIICFSGIPHHASSSSNSHLEFQRYPPYQMFGSMHKVYVQLCLNITVAAIIIRDFFGFAHHFSRIFHTSHLHGREVWLEELTCISNSLVKQRN
ncbi:hypothetical protein AAZV13_01G059900 [Glycine max]